MISIDREAAKIRSRDEMIRKLYQVIIALGLIIITLVIMILVLIGLP